MPQVVLNMGLQFNGHIQGKKIGMQLLLQATFTYLHHNGNATQKQAHHTVIHGKTMSTSSACTLVNISSYTTSTLMFACHREKRQFVPPMSAVRRTSFCSCAKQLL